MHASVYCFAIRLAERFATFSNMIFKLLLLLDVILLLPSMVLLP